MWDDVWYSKKCIQKVIKLIIITYTKTTDKEIVKTKLNFQKNFLMCKIRHFRRTDVYKAACFV